MRRLRAVFDCMVFLQGIARKQSPAGLCLLLAAERSIDLYVSEPILTELGSVLRRPKIRAKFSELTEDRVVALERLLGEVCVTVDDVPREFQLIRDPKDEPYLNLACAIEADFLVSRDRDLLDLAASNDDLGMALRSRHPQLQIVEPEVFLVNYQKE